MKSRQRKRLLHQGLHYARIRWNDRERAFAWIWRAWCRPQPGINRGYGYLQDLMYIDPLRSRRCHITSDVFSGFRMQERPAFIIRRRDAAIVATVIQWLGSNVGMSFLREALGQCGYMIVEMPKRRTPDPTPDPQRPADAVHV